MGKTRRAGIILILCFAIVVALGVCFLLGRSATLVTDSSTKVVFSSRYLAGLRLDYALKGYRLRIKVLDDSAFWDSSLFTASLQGIRSDLVILTPVPMAYVSENGIDVSSLLVDSTVLGVGEKGSEYVDCLLVSDESTGWFQASSSLANEVATTSRNVGVVHESSDASLIQGIVASFPAGGVSLFEHEPGNASFFSRALSSMDRLGIVVAMCPYVSDMEKLFLQDSGVRWVVDYRFRTVVPSDRLYGIVAPDYVGLLSEVSSLFKGQHQILPLRYVYEKRLRLL